MDITRTAAAPADAAGAADSGVTDDWETMVLGRRRTASPYFGHSRPPEEEPIFAELVGQWLALGRTVPAAHGPVVSGFGLGGPGVSRPGTGGARVSDPRLLVADTARPDDTATGGAEAGGTGVSLRLLPLS